MLYGWIPYWKLYVLMRLTGAECPNPRPIILIVRNYDEAIAWFTGVLGFTLTADEYQLEQDKRWVPVAPPGAGDNAATLLLACAA